VYDACIYVITIDGRAVCDNILCFESSYAMLGLTTMLRDADIGTIKIIEKSSCKNPLVYKEDLLIQWLLEKSRTDYQKVSSLGYLLYGKKPALNTEEEYESDVEDSALIDSSIDTHDSLMTINEVSHDMDDWNVRGPLD
jgi:hypothetical protein